MSEPVHGIAIPKWGIEMVEGTIVSWIKDVGDTISKGEEVVEIESDKIVNALEAPASGILRRQLVQEGEALRVGTLIGVIASEVVSDQLLDDFVTAYVAPVSSGAEDPGTPTPAPQSVAPERTPSAARTGRVSPVVRRRAKELGVDLATVTGSGSGGRITAEDVERAVAGTAQSAAPIDVSNEAGNAASVTPLTSMRKTIGRRLVESKQSVPHFYLSIDIEIDGLLAARAELNSAAAQKISINDLIVWCTARALLEVPGINAHLVDDEIHQFAHADICIAVATDRGLLTPILRKADELSPAEIAAATAVLIDKAKSGGLERGDIDGGTFTVSNLGMYGVTRFDAIVNSPQVAILALGQAKRAIAVRDNDATAVATIIGANLSCDHRVVDGALGGAFLSALKREIEAMGA